MFGSKQGFGRWVEKALEIALNGAEIIILMRVKVNSFKGMLMDMLLDEFTLQTVTNVTNINSNLTLPG